MLPGEDGWQDNDSEYAYQVFHYMDDRTWLQMQDSAFYMVSYGDAAMVNNSELFAKKGVRHFAKHLTKYLTPVTLSERLSRS